MARFRPYHSPFRHLPCYHSWLVTNHTGSRVAWHAHSEMVRGCACSFWPQVPTRWTARLYDSPPQTPLRPGARSPLTPLCTKLVNSCHAGFSQHIGFKCGLHAAPDLRTQGSWLSWPVLLCQARLFLPAAGSQGFRATAWGGCPMW